MIAQLGTAKINHEQIVTWEPLPKDFQLERQLVEQERQQKERLMDYLRSQGIDPDNLPASDG